MKLSQSTLVAVAATCALVNAAPAQVNEESSNTDLAVAKRANLDRALAQLQDLDKMKVKRAEIDHQLTQREYKIVTEILTLIKDTDLAPVVLDFIISNSTLRAIAIKAIVWVLENGNINLTTLLTYLVKSGLLDTVLTDVLSDCEVYESVISIAEEVVVKIIGSILKREDLAETPTLTHAQAVDLMKKDAMYKPSMLETYKKEEKRDLEDVILNVLESLGDSGLASQVVIAILTDDDLVDFGSDLISALSDADTGITLSDIVTAITSSGIISDLLSLIANSSTLSTIVSNVLKVIDGTCSSDSSSTTTKTTATAATTTSTKAATTYTTGTGTATTTTNYYTTTSYTTTTSAADVGTVYTTVDAVSVTASTDACSSAVAKREFKRLRLNY